VAIQSLEHLAEGHDWRMCEALLTLHAIADEACAGLGVALDRSDGKGCVYRARGRELLARTGSLARIGSHFLRVLPKVRTHVDHDSATRIISLEGLLSGPFNRTSTNTSGSIPIGSVQQRADHPNFIRRDAWGYSPHHSAPPPGFVVLESRSGRVPR
jgi:hypothetical protein